MTPHERKLVGDVMLQKHYTGRLMESRTIQAAVTYLLPKEIEQLRGLKTFAEIMEKIGELKARKLAGG